MKERSEPRKAADDLAKKAVEDHRRLLKVLRRIEDSEDPRELADRLDDLQMVLERHFEHEEDENEGLFAIVESRAVHLHGEVEKLRADHRRLTDWLKELCTRVESSDAGDHRGLRDEVAGFIASLRDHEARETALFMDSWNTDLGAQD